MRERWRVSAGRSHTRWTQSRHVPQLAQCLPLTDMRGTLSQSNRRELKIVKRRRKGPAGVHTRWKDDSDRAGIRSPGGPSLKRVSGVILVIWFDTYLGPAAATSLEEDATLDSIPEAVDNTVREVY